MVLGHRRPTEKGDHRREEVGELEFLRQMTRRLEPKLSLGTRRLPR